MDLFNEFTPAQLERVSAEWSRIAQEPVKIEEIKGTVYAFGSELACYRLAHKFRSFNVKHSANCNSWYFSLERQF